VVAFVPQPPFALQAVQGANAQNLTQTFFFAAQSKTLTDGVPDALQLSFQIGKANSVPPSPLLPCPISWTQHSYLIPLMPLLDRFSRIVEASVCTVEAEIKLWDVNEKQCLLNKTRSQFRLSRSLTIFNRVQEIHIPCAGTVGCLLF
jgi:hypothetical protein